MSATPSLSRIPALRILLPFVIGILISHVCSGGWWLPVVLIAVAMAAYTVISRMSSSSPSARLRWRPFFILPLALVAMSLGWLTAIIHTPPHLDDRIRSGTVLGGRVAEVDFTDFSMRLTVDVIHQDASDCKVLLSTRGCDYTMQPGTLVAWQAGLHEVTNMGNPDEMDYASYLLHNKGIRYQQHLPLDKIKKVGISPTPMTRLSVARRNIQLMVLNSRLSPESQQFVIAMLLGNSGFIEHETRQEFSAAGIAHILALSGLHVGLIALLVWWLLFPLDYLRLRWARLLITILAITLFAVFTGLSPSVVRATVMTGFVFASLIFYRRSVSLNALAMSALLILIFSPSAIYSVGFQLSFITVAALLSLARVPDTMQSRFLWVNKLTASAMASLVAMLATVALTAHYFHTVSVLTVISNLLILPVMPVFMTLGAIFLLVAAAGMSWPWLEGALDAMSHYLSWSAQSVNSIPWAHFDGVYVSSFGVLAYFVVMAFVLLWFYRRNYRYLMAAAVAVVALLAHSLWVDATTPRRGLVVLNSFDSTPILYYQGSECYVWTPDNEDTDSADFMRFHAGFMARHAIDRLTIVGNNDTLRLDHGQFIKPPVAFLMNRRLVAVGRGPWKSLSTTRPLALDDIIVTKRYHSTVAKLTQLYRFDRLILSGAIHQAAPVMQECDSLNVRVHNLADQGAVVFQ